MQYRVSDLMSYRLAQAGRGAPSWVRRPARVLPNDLVHHVYCRPHPLYEVLGVGYQSVTEQFDHLGEHPRWREGIDAVLPPHPLEQFVPDSCPSAEIHRLSTHRKLD